MNQEIKHQIREEFWGWMNDRGIVALGNAELDKIIDRVVALAVKPKDEEITKIKKQAKLAQSIYFNKAKVLEEEFHADKCSFCHKANKVEIKEMGVFCRKCADNWITLFGAKSTREIAGIINARLNK